MGVSKIDFWDVGHGDSSVIHLNDGSLILIDVGRKGSPVTAWLRRMKSVHIRAALITHNHADHVGGLESLLGEKHIQLDQVAFVPYGHTTTPKIEKLARALASLDVAGVLKVAQKGDHYFEDEHWKLTAWAPSPLGYIKTASIDERSASYVLLYDETVQVFWPGDASLSSVREELNGRHTHLLFGPHHGNPKDSGLKSFLTDIGGINLDRAFMSLQTPAGRITQPNKVYVRELAKKGCRVTCSQITPNCRMLKDYDKVIDGTQLLGLHAQVRPEKQIPCRGTFRLVWNSAEECFDADDYEDIHREYIQIRVSTPMCELSST